MARKESSLLLALGGLEAVGDFPFADEWQAGVRRQEANLGGIKPHPWRRPCEPPKEQETRGTALSC